MDKIVRKKKEDYIVNSKSLKIKRQSEYKKKKRNFLFFSLSLASFFLFVFCIFLLRTEKLSISKINVIGGREEINREIEKLSATFLTGDYVKIFPRKNIIIYPKKSLQEEIKNKFSNIQELDISISSGPQIDIKIKEVTPFLYLSQSGDSENIGNIFIDENAYVFVSSLDTPSLYLEVVERDNLKTNLKIRELTNLAFETDQEKTFSIKDNLGKNINKQYFDQFKIVLDNLKKRNKKVLSAEIFPEQVVYFTLEKEGIFRVDLKNNLETVFSRYDSALSNPKFKDLYKDNVSNLEYMDLRFGSKIFYKFTKNSKEGEVENATTSIKQIN